MTGGINDGTKDSMNQDREKDDEPMTEFEK